MAKITRRFLAGPDNKRLKKSIIGTLLGNRQAQSLTKEQEAVHRKMVEHYVGREVTDEEYRDLQFLL